MFSFVNKVVVVTGTGSGIGEEIARQMASLGATLICVDRDGAGQDKADALGAEFHSCDIAQASDCETVGKSVLTKHGRCDVLINNAGIGHVGTALTTKPEDLDRIYSVNVRGTLQFTQAFLPAMVAAKNGSIVNLASIGGIVGISDRLAYCATKFAVVGLTKCMALDHALDNVRVNCVCPGRVETPFVQARIAEYPDPAAAYREMASTQALKRMATPAEIAASVIYLASDEAAFVTGSALIIDGGWTAGK